MILSKYEGLKRIEIFGLPHPDWRFVSSPDQIPEIAWIDANHGWSIRACPRDRYEYALPSKHYISYEKIRSQLIELQSKVDVTDFVIYPSWRFNYSGNMLLTADDVTIEVVKGDIGPLLQGVKTPDIIYYAKGPWFSKIYLSKGCEDLLTSFEKSIFVRAAQTILFRKFVVLEWSKTTDGHFFFHDFQDFD